MDRKKNYNDIQLIWLIVIISVIIIIMLWVLNFKPPKYTVSDNSEHWDHFGSYLSGAVGSILQIATIYLLVYSIRIQKDELSELVSNQKISSFETTFFNLINLHHTITQSITGITLYSHNNVYFSGREFFNKLVIDCIDLYEKDRVNSLNEIGIFLRENSYLFYHYINNIMVILNLASKNPNIDLPKDYYIKIFKAQLSLQESIILAYAAYYIDIYSDLKEKIIEYDLLDKNEVGFSPNGQQEGSYIIYEIIKTYFENT